MGNLSGIRWQSESPWRAAKQTWIESTDRTCPWNSGNKNIRGYISISKEGEEKKMNNGMPSEQTNLLTVPLASYELGGRLLRIRFLEVNSRLGLKYGIPHGAKDGLKDLRVRLQSYNVALTLTTRTSRST
jgi:hypothetical protein